MSRSEWRSVLLLALVVVVITTAPYCWRGRSREDDWHFSGFLFGVEDGNSYLGKMRLGARGVWDFFLFYTPEAHDSVPLVFLPYILPGQIVGHLFADTDPALTPALIVTYHVMRVVFDALLIVADLPLLRRLPERAARPPDSDDSGCVRRRTGLAASTHGTRAKRAPRRFLHPRRLQLPDPVRLAASGAGAGGAARRLAGGDAEPSLYGYRRGAGALRPYNRASALRRLNGAGCWSRASAGWSSG